MDNTDKTKKSGGRGRGFGRPSNTEKKGMRGRGRGALKFVGTPPSPGLSRLGQRDPDRSPPSKLQRLSAREEFLADQFILEDDQFNLECEAKVSTSFTLCGIEASQCLSFGDGLRRPLLT